ncbi:hypothetical protein EMIHUDRAFT_95194 [Emiliania huxleyi CCMP1516]|uniref:Major facilitator superfamily (MFS) profile domain-containing protein n=2 Tax=Emiliania huxleyi TaxID=2903 RepID=A0A0D3L1X6_EMIH1|nr:hypothetical protein EMIHUDRAFT_95194 [Emiliania huxleyi CCMP1516]EOD42011.1 hypothetical protein EMIHUDRAFT_95194 [Emiliania huxleyi CCMP1516]|eukprot:XP_005794440.1 hypothetical protein EMIHUDRAFT_95194 [Emiliania huxleyi CCMP1516]
MPRLSTRKSLILLLWLGDVCLYMARTNVSVAIGAMFSSDAAEGRMLAAFYCGYFAFQTPAGWLASRFGGSRVLTAAVAVWSLASAASCFTRGAFAALFALRVLVGCAEACCYPSMAQLVSVWIPTSERSSSWAFITTGEPAGTVLMLLLGPFLLASTGWRSVFLVARGVTPWRAILTNRPFLCTATCHCLYNWTFYIGLSWIDKFLHTTWPNASSADLAAASAAPYVALFACSAASGVVADRLEARGLSPTRTRKLINSAGLLGGAAGFGALSCVAPCGGGSSAPRGATLLCLGSSAGYWATFGDLSRRHGALLLAMSNTAASLPGIVGNTATGQLLASTRGDWALVFRLCAGSLVLGALAFLGSEARDQLLDDSPRGMLSSKLLVAPGEPGGSEEEGSGASTAAGPTVQAARGCKFLLTVTEYQIDVWTHFNWGPLQHDE